MDDVKNIEEQQGDYKPLFMEEIFIVNLYGTDEEIELFYKLIQNSDDIDNQVIMVDLIEKIKRKYLTKMNWFCCSLCQHYEICRINWYRGEKNIDRNCCSLCQNYNKCRQKHREEMKKNEENKKIS